MKKDDVILLLTTFAGGLLKPVVTDNGYGGEIELVVREPRRYENREAALKDLIATIKG